MTDYNLKKNKHNEIIKYLTCTPKVFCLTFGVHVKLESRIFHLHKIFYSAVIKYFVLKQT